MIQSHTVRVRIPARIDFAGGWSDVHYFAAREGGAVLNAAINRYVVGEAASNGGRMRVSYRSAIPHGAGLGGSAALDVAWLALTNGLMGRLRSAVELAEDAYRLEKILGVEGGKQDQYASALGGFNLLRFAREEEPAVVEPLPLEAGIVKLLEERLVLCYSGRARHSGDLHERVWAPFLAGDARILHALREMRDSVEPVRDALLRGDIESLGDLMSVNREAARNLVPELVTPTMDRLMAAARDAGSIGAKACGAGGGGCLVFACRSGAAGSVMRALRAEGAKVLRFQFEATSKWAGRADGRPESPS